MKTNRHLAVFAFLLCVAVVSLFSRPAAAVDRNFAASAQVDYMGVPTQKNMNAAGIGFDGMTTELSVKIAADVSDHLSANVKFCYGCHGLEADMMYLDYRFADELNIRFGRFSPSFGAFNLRHDPANHRTSDKPLPYDMGRMLGLRAWNLGVLPAPFPDNGAEANGTHWFGDENQLDYAAYIVSGFKADSGGTDIDFTQNRELYYIDNNGHPTYGGRAALTHKFSETTDGTLGVSGMRGTADPNNKFFYDIFGADATLRINRTTIRAEYLARREDFDASDPTKFRYAIPTNNGNFFIKHGYYVELEAPVTSRFDFIVRADGLLRVGDVTKDSLLDRVSSVERGTIGTAFLVERDLRLKASVEGWHFSDKDVTTHYNELSFHVGAVGTF